MHTILNWTSALICLLKICCGVLSTFNSLIRSVLQWQCAAQPLGVLSTAAHPSRQAWWSHWLAQWISVCSELCEVMWQRLVVVVLFETHSVASFQVHYALCCIYLPQVEKQPVTRAVSWPHVPYLDRTAAKSLQFPVSSSLWCGIAQLHEHFCSEV